MNKLFGLFLLSLAFLAPNVANAAACFWVGGTGSINDVTHWSSGTGGAGSTCAAAGGWPNSTSDTGTFDASSGGGTITRNVSWTIGTLTTGAFTGTFGNSTDSAAVNVTTLNNSASGVRTFNLGASTWTLAAAGSWTMPGSNLTFNANTSTVVFSGSTTGTQTLANIGALTYNVITFSADSSGANKGTYVQTGGSSTVATLNVGAPNFLVMDSARTMNVTTLNFTGGSPAITALTTFAATQPNVSQTNLALTSPTTCSNFCALRDINFTSSAFTANNSINLGNNTNATINAPSVGGGGGGRIIGG